MPANFFGFGGIISTVRCDTELVQAAEALYVTMSEPVRSYSIRHIRLRETPVAMNAKNTYAHSGFLFTIS